MNIWFGRRGNCASQPWFMHSPPNRCFQGGSPFPGDSSSLPTGHVFLSLCSLLPHTHSSSLILREAEAVDPGFLLSILKSKVISLQSNLERDHPYKRWALREGQDKTSRSTGGIKRVKLSCLHISRYMYRNAFLHANYFNPGVASIITSDRRGKTARFSSESWNE